MRSELCAEGPFVLRAWDAVWGGCAALGLAAPRRLWLCGLDPVELAKEGDPFPREEAFVVAGSEVKGDGETTGFCGRPPWGTPAR